jgi:hypothetical protein
MGYRSFRSQVRDKIAADGAQVCLVPFHFEKIAHVMFRWLQILALMALKQLGITCRARTLPAVLKK